MLTAIQNLEFASHGYYVIANGHPDATFTSGPGGNQPPRATGADFFDAVNWVSKEAEAGKLPNVDAKHIIGAGSSCGGLDAYTAAQDKRVTHTILLSSGTLNVPIREKLVQVQKTPVGMFIGGKYDSAYKNALDDFAALKGVARTFASGPFGHGMGGTSATQAALRWLDWQVRGNASAKVHFTNPSDTFLKNLRFDEVKSADV
jgi:hypothetical protein